MANRLNESVADGLTIGIHERQVATSQLRGEPGVGYDVTSWSWLGSLSVDQYVFGVHTRSGVTPSNFDPLRTKEIRTANVSPGDFAHLTQVVLKTGLGWNLAPRFGYQGERGVVLSADRGETDGATLSWITFLSEKPDDLPSRIIVPLVQFGGRRSEPLAADVPTAAELFTNATPQAKQLLAYVESPLRWSRSLSAPPAMDPMIAATMRAAFGQMTADPGFLADADRLSLEILPLSGERIQTLIGDYMRTSPETLRVIDEQVRAQTLY